LSITQTEQVKIAMQVKQTAEKLYYGLLILQKQKEEAELKLAQYVCRSFPKMEHPGYIFKYLCKTAAHV